MVNAYSAQLFDRLFRPTTVEMDQRFEGSDGTNYDGAEDLEAAMAARVFRDLQRDGYIEADRKLADYTGWGAYNPFSSEPRSYEAAIVDAIRDRDGNGRLDLDVDRLKPLLDEEATSDELIRSVSGRTGALSDDFLKAQSKDSGVAFAGIVNERGKGFQTSTARMRLLTPDEKQFEDRIAATKAKAETDAPFAGANSRLYAKEYAEAESPARGAEFLARSGQELAKGGSSRQLGINGDVLTSEYADVPVNGFEGTFRGRTGDTVSVKLDGTQYDFAPKAHETTYGEVGATMRMQAEFIDEAKPHYTGTKKFDPQNPDHVRPYFQHLSDSGASTAELADAFDGYANAFFVHTGGGVDYTSSIARDDRADQFAKLTRHAPKDVAGRKAVDCEGSNALTEAIFGGLTDARGDPAFDVVHGGSKTHVVAGVRSRETGESFVANNLAAEDLSPAGEAISDEVLLDRMGGAIARTVFTDDKRAEYAAAGKVHEFSYGTNFGATYDASSPTHTYPIR